MLLVEVSGTPGLSLLTEMHLLEVVGLGERKVCLKLIKAAF